MRAALAAESIWESRKKGSNPNVCCTFIKLVSICQAENSQKPKVGVSVFNHGCHGYHGCSGIRELSALSAQSVVKTVRRIGRQEAQKAQESEGGQGAEDGRE